MTKSYWSSSNDIDCVSPVEFSLRNLNFSTLVNNNDDGKNKTESDNAHEISLGDDDEKSVRMEQVSGYETPYLGMKINPSCENLRKNPHDLSSDEDEDTYQGKKVVHNKKLGYNDQKVDAVSLIINANLKAMNRRQQTNTAILPSYLLKQEEKDSDESLGNEDLVKEKPRYSRKSRNSTYFESMQEFKNRSSRGKSLFNTFNKEKEEEKQQEAVNKLIWGGYHKIITDNQRVSMTKDDADEEAEFIEGAKAPPVSNYHKGAWKRKVIARHSKSSTKYKPYYQA